MKQLWSILFFLCSAVITYSQHGDLSRSKEFDMVRKNILSSPNLSPVAIIQQLDSLLKSSGDLKKYPINRAEILIEKGKKEQTIGALDDATESFTKAFKIFDGLQFKNGMISALVNLGILNNVLHNPKVSQEYLEHALRISEGASNTVMANILLNLAVANDMQEKSLDAIKIYQRALSYAKKENNKETIATLYHGIGIAYTLMGDFKNGEPYEIKALESNPSPKLKSQILGSLGSFYLEHKMPAKSEKCLLEAIQIAEKENFWDVLLTCYLNLSDFYRSENRAEEAIIQMEKYIRLQDSIEKRNTNNQLQDQEMKFRFDLQKKALEVSELKSANQKKGFFALGFICLLLIGISFMTYRNYRLNQKANQLLAAEKNRIEQERQYLEEEFILLQKENLLAKFETLRDQINPHFLFNALNSLYALVDKDPKKSKDFIKQFSLMYRKVLEFNDLTVITLQKEIEFVNHYLYLQKIRFGENLKVNVHIHSVLNYFYLPPFSLQILIENAVKHNEVSSDHPLEIEINTDLETKTLRVINSLNSRKESEFASTGTGLNNIIKRYQILSDLSPEFIIQQHSYLAILPLLEEEL